MISAPWGSLGAFLAVFARCAGYLYSAPIIGEHMVPPRLRVAVAVLAALAISPGREQLSVDALFSTILLEALLGLAAGFAGRVLLSGAEAGGQLIGLSMGLGFASTFDPSSGEEALPTRRLCFILGGLAFLSAGGLEVAFRVVSVAPLSVGLSLLTFYQRGGEVFLAGLRMAAPAMLAGLVVNVSTALASHASPALNIFSVALPLLLLVGMGVLVITAPSMLQEVLFLRRQVTELFR